MGIIGDTQLHSRPGPARRLSRIRAEERTTEVKEKTRFAFIGLSGSAGVTMLAFAFADFLAARLRPDATVAVVEINDAPCPPAGFDFDRMGMDKHFENREYISFYDMIARGKPIRGISNMDGGVNWMLRVPGERYKPLEIVDFSRLAANAEGDVIICDIHGGFRRGQADGIPLPDDIRKLLDDMDRVFVIVDPLPSRMMADPRMLEVFKDLEANGREVVYVLNKWNRGVNAREVKAFLRVKNPVFIQLISGETIYAAEYNCQTVAAMPEGRDKLYDSFKKMLYHHSLSMFI
jgi:hypothetical protein